MVNKDEYNKFLLTDYTADTPPNRIVCEKFIFYKQTTKKVHSYANLLPFIDPATLTKIYILMLKELNSLKRLVRTTVAMSHN